MAKMQLIDAVALSERVIDSKFDNHHLTYEAVRTHFYEHDHFLHMIRSAPVVDAVEVVHAEWHVCETVPLLEMAVKCSACNHVTYYPKDRWTDIRLTTYCPDCGAIMHL